MVAVDVVGDAVAATVVEAVGSVGTVVGDEEVAASVDVEFVDTPIGDKVVVTPPIKGGGELGVTPTVGADVGATTGGGTGFGFELNTNATSTSNTSPPPPPLSSNVKQFVLPLLGLTEFCTLGVAGSPFHTSPNR